MTVPVVVTVAVCVLGAVCVAAVGYLLLLLMAAAAAAARVQALQRHRQQNSVPAPSSPLRFAVIVPAHNEELVIGAMLESLSRLDYPADLIEVVVVADNCDDTTAEIARAAGANVYERFNKIERGKGYALAEVMHSLLAQERGSDAFVIVDADTFVAPDFLRVMAAAVLQGSAADPQGRVALQGRYGVLNAGAGWRSALMAGAFDLFNHVKPLGRDALGFSVGLKGNGMVFSRQLLAAAPFTGSSITEDIDYGLDLLLHHGVRVGYVPDALVKAQMPVTGAQAKSQRERWEHGRFKLMRERVPVLLAFSLRRSDIRLADAAVDLLLPPLAEIAALLALWAALTLFGVHERLLVGATSAYVGILFAAAVGFVVYVLAGFKLAGAPRDAYVALLKAPGYALWKFATLAGKPLSRLRRKKASAAAGDEWVRTERIAMSAQDGRIVP